MSSSCNARVGAHFKIDAHIGCAFLEHDADGVNDFLVHSGAAMDGHVIAREFKSARRLHVTRVRDRARRCFIARGPALVTTATRGGAR
jgi:sugar/nucleoside kinase (ribokinase family)